MTMSPPSDSAQALQIAILGAGKIGSGFGFQLARAGHAVTMVARSGSDRLNQLQRDGCILNIKGERAEVRILSELDTSTPYDLLIVTLLAHQVIAVMPDLQRSAARCIQFMFNTFQPERLQELIGHDRCAFGMPFIQAMIESNGRLKTTIGAGGQKTIMNRQQWVDVFNAAGLPAKLEADMPLWLRCHAPLCVAFESVSVAGQRRSGGASWAEAITLGRGVQASFQLIEALGYPIYPQGKKLLQRSSTIGIAAVLWSMSRVRSFRELLATGKAEANAIVNVMADSARTKLPAAVPKIEAMAP